MCQIVAQQIWETETPKGYYHRKILVMRIKQIKSMSRKMDALKIGTVYQSGSDSNDSLGKDKVENDPVQIDLKVEET